MKIENKTYDILAWIGRILLPALSVLYSTLGKIWNLPFTEQIPLTIMAVDVFWNAILGISSKAYFEEHDVVPNNTMDENGKG